MSVNLIRCFCRVVSIKWPDLNIFFSSEKKDALMFIRSVFCIFPLIQLYFNSEIGIYSDAIEFVNLWFYMWRLFCSIFFTISPSLVSRQSFASWVSSLVFL